MINQGVTQFLLVLTAGLSLSVIVPQFAVTIVLKALHIVGGSAFLDNAMLISGLAL